MNSSAHDEWAAQRKQEARADKAKRFSKGKSVLRVVLTVVLGVVLLNVLGNAYALALGPVIAGVWAAIIWKKAYPSEGVSDVLFIARIYQWSYSRNFRALAQDAFRGGSKWWKAFTIFARQREDITEFFEDAETYKKLAQDLPDLDRLSADEAYAKRPWGLRRRRRYVALVALSLPWNLYIVFSSPWGIFSVLTMLLLLRPVAQAAAGGPLPAFMLAHARLAGWIREFNTPRERTLTADQLRSLTEAGSP